MQADIRIVGLQASVDSGERAHAKVKSRPVGARRAVGGSQVLRPIRDASAWQLDPKPKYLRLSDRAEPVDLRAMVPSIDL